MICNADNEYPYSPESGSNRVIYLTKQKEGKKKNEKNYNNKQTNKTNKFCNKKYASYAR